jgi:drug/metabolite transporter (DMT)-like permease
MVVGIVAALLSAVCYGVASVLQARAARAETSATGVDPGLLLRLLRRAPFLIGLLFDAGGFAAQFVALRVAPVFMVQAALAASLAVTAIVAVPVIGVRLRGREWAAIAAVSVGLAMLGVSAGTEGAADTGTGFRWALLASVVVLAVVGLAAGRLADPLRSALLGLVAGLAFGAVALAARALNDLSPGRLVRNPAAYALLAAGAAAFVFYANGLHRGAVTVVTAAVVIGETLPPAAIGIAVLGDHTRAGLTPLAVAGFVVALLGAFGLTRFGEVPQRGPAYPAG